MLYLPQLYYIPISQVLAEGFLLVYIEHTLPYQNMARSLALPSMIVHQNDSRKKKRTEANSISHSRKSKPSTRSWHTNALR
jgi:hypothetical protein